MKDIRYLTDHYDEKIRRINEIGAPVNFVFITDLHSRLNHWATLHDPEFSGKPYELAVNHVASVQYILDRCPGITHAICGGDIGNDYSHDPAEIRASHDEIMEALYALSVPVHCCIGNHDDAVTISTLRGDNNIPFAILPDELHRRCMRNNPTDKNYYFLDHPNELWRFVFLNSIDRPYFKDENDRYTLQPALCISMEQVEWLKNDALKTERRILIFSHAPLRNEGVFGTCDGPLYIKPHDDTYISETAFDVFSIKDNVMYITRFGAGEDRIATLLR